jgi:hypothetical protein
MDLSDLMLAMAAEGTPGGFERQRWQRSRDEESSSEGGEQPTSSSSKISTGDDPGKREVNGVEGSKRADKLGSEDEMYAALGRMVWQFMNQGG